MRQRPRKVGQRVTAIVIVVLVLWIDPASKAGGQNQFGGPIEVRPDLTQRFEARWKSIVLSATVLNRLGSREGGVSSPNWTLTVGGEVEILDCNDLVGTGASPIEITKVIGADGNDVEAVFAADAAGSWRSYRRLEYYYPGVWDSSLGTYRQTAKPYDLSVSLGIDPNKALVSSLAVIEGYIYALYAENTIEIDVPFRASEDWVQSAPDLQTCVISAGLDCCNWMYHTALKSTTASLGALGDRLDLEDHVADYIVLEVQVFALPDPGIRMFAASKIVGSSSQAGAGGFYGVDCLGEVADRGYPGVKTVRHIIAAHPIEVKIPFALRDIPMPSLPLAEK
jgi:hypothetical protein